MVISRVIPIWISESKASFIIYYIINSNIIILNGSHIPVHVNF